MEFSRLVNTFTAKGFSEISLVTQLKEPVFRTHKLMKYFTYEASFFWEHPKFNVAIKSGKKMRQNIYGFSEELIKLVSENSLYYFGNTRSSQSTCYQANLRSQIWLKITFSNSIWLRVTEKYDKSTFLQIPGHFGTR